MPRTYKCRKCGIIHPPPTGKHCWQAVEVEPDPQDDTQTQILAAIQLLQTDMAAMKTQIRSQASTTNCIENNESISDIEEGSEPSENGAQGGNDSETATPQS